MSAFSTQTGGTHYKDLAIQPTWKEYPHDTRYEVSDSGKVRMKGRPIRKPSHTPFGYEVIIVVDNGKKVGRYVHRMVMETFVGPCQDNCTVSHLNGICDDNRLSNLSYETMKENNGRKKYHGTYTSGAAHHSSKLTDTDADCIRQCSDKTWRKLAEHYGVHIRTIARIKAGDTYRRQQ